MGLLHRWMLRRFGITQTHPVVIRRGIKVPAPGRVALVSDLYLGSPEQAAPAIMIRSPYGRSALLAAATAYPLAAQGFNVVMQSCRGTFGSEGTFDPHHDEERDGLATLDWIRREPWCNGSIATFGMSYLGYTQWAVAAGAGPALKAMAMQVTLADFSRMTYAGNSFSLKTALSWTQMMTFMKTPRGMLRVVLSQLLRRPPINESQWRALPLASLDEKVAGERVGFWQDWLQHAASEDPWWQPMNFRASIDRVRLPITMTAGWYDIFLPWQLEDFAALRHAGSQARITIGPWRHADADLGAHALRDAIEWFRHHLLGGAAPQQSSPVKLYVVGADEWRSFDEWPPRESSVERWYLQPQAQLADRVAPDSPPDRYRYDPRDPTPAVGGPALEMVPYAVDNAALEARADVLIYTSAPLPRPRDLIGPVAAELFVASSAQSADFFVRLCDVDPQGVSKNICDGLQRVRIDSAGVPQAVRVELWPTACRIAQGHRLRVQISSGAFPRWARNPGGLEPLGTATELHVADQSIHHSPTYPSAVLLPFMSG